MSITVKKPEQLLEPTELTARLKRFVAASRARGATPPASPRRKYFAEAFCGRYTSRPYWERYARSLAFALEKEPVYVFPDERLVGMLYQISPQPGLSPETDAALAQYDTYRMTYERLPEGTDFAIAGPGAFGHIGWRWELLLEEGIEGLMARLRELLASARTRQAKRLYKGALLLWQAVLRWQQAHLAALRAAAEHAEGAEKERLTELVALCERVPRYPACTFHEAVQSFHFQHLTLMFENPYGGNGPGRVDQVLWPYLKADLEAGRITWQEARDLVDELLVRFHERLQPGDGWVEAVTVGGTTIEGASAVNPLSHLIIESIIGLRQTHPSVYVRLPETEDEAFLDLSVRYLLEGENRAQLYSDRACLAAIETSGVPRADAVEFMAGGCMEISVQGRASDFNFTRVYNVAKRLELVLTGGLDLLSGERRLNLPCDLTGYRSFEALYQAFDQVVRTDLAQMGAALDLHTELVAHWRPCYLLSSLVDDCLERGLEQQEGGARYHDYGFAPIGITTAADSLAGLKQALFDEGFVSADELLAALKANFQGHEALRARLLRLPKFGKEDLATDALCDQALHTVCDAALTTKTRFGGLLKPMLFNFVWTPWASAELGARADGSLAGESIGHGMTPQRRGMTEGLTAALNSCCSLDFDCVAGGATTMWDVDPVWATHENLKTLVKRFVEGGGMILQGNTTSVADLEEALEHPERHPELIVRVGGFSARFVLLEKANQEEIVQRYRHSR